MSRAKNEPQSANEPATQADQFGGSIASYNEPPGSDIAGQKFTVESIDPTTAEAGGEDVTLHVHGTGFEDGAQVVIDGNAAETTFVSGTELTAVMAAASAAGTTLVSVTQTGLIFDPPQHFTWTEPVEGRSRRRR